MSLAFILRKSLTFIYFVMIARWMGVEMTGLYFLITAFTSIVNTFMDFGLSSVLIREASKNTDKLQEYFSDVIGIKIILCFATAVCGCILITMLNYPDLTRRLVYLAFVIIILESFADTFYSCLRTKHIMKYEAGGMVIGQLITVLLGGLSIFFFPSIYLLIFALLFNQIFNFIYSLKKVRTELNLTPRPRYSIAAFRFHMAIALPFLIAAVFQRLLAADTFILSSITDNTAIGLFSIPSTLITTLQFIPYAVTAAIFPALSSFFITSKERLKKTFDGAFLGLYLLSCPIAALLYVLSPNTIQMIFGEKYLAAADILSVLALSLVPFFISFPLGAVLDACNKQVLNTMLLGITSAIHFLLALLLVPHLGVMGIALATLVSYVFLFISNFYFVRTLLTLKGYYSKLVGISLAALCMGIIVHFLNPLFSTIVIVLFGIILYLLFILILKHMFKAEIGIEYIYHYWFYSNKHHEKEEAAL